MLDPALLRREQDDPASVQGRRQAADHRTPSGSAGEARGEIGPSSRPNRQGSRSCELGRVAARAESPGGKTPVLPPAKLQEVGYKLALYPVMLLSSAITAMQSTLAALRPDSKTPQPPAISFTDLQGVVGFPDYWSRETRYQAKEKE